MPLARGIQGLPAVGRVEWLVEVAAAGMGVLAMRAWDLVPAGKVVEVARMDRRVR